MLELREKDGENGQEEWRGNRKRKQENLLKFSAPTSRNNSFRLFDDNASNFSVSRRQPQYLFSFFFFHPFPPFYLHPVLYPFSEVGNLFPGNSVPLNFKQHAIHWIIYSIFVVYHLQRRVYVIFELILLPTFIITFIFHFNAVM